MTRFLCVIFLFVLQACGTSTEYKKAPSGGGGKGGGEAYTWAQMQDYCLTCHNSSAPAIPTDENGFQASSKVRARIENGSMPPAAAKGDFDAARAIAYLDSVR